MENIAASAFKGLLQINRGALNVIVRNNRINVQKPRPSHYKRAQVEHLTRPKYFERGERESWFIPSVSQCMKAEEEKFKLLRKDQDDNPYEHLLAKDLRNWFLKSKLIAFFHTNPIKLDDRFEVEVRLRKEGMYLKKLGKHTVGMAVEGTPYVSVMPLFATHTEMVFCSEPKVDALLKVAGKMHNHVLLAAVVEDRLLSVSQLKALRQVKDLTTARTQLVQVLNTAQSQLVHGLTYHQTSIAEGLRQYAANKQDSDKTLETKS